MENFIINFVWLQLIGTAFGVVQVLLSRKNNIHNYLFGIISILISLWILYHSKLYADILLHLYYLIMSIYGWFYWKYGKNKSETEVSHSTKKEDLVAGSIVLGCFALMTYWLTNHTNSDVPIWDSLVSAFAWAGMWLMAKRKIENWVYLNISNIISIPLLIYKGLWIYAALTIFLFIVGVSGYLKWKKLIKIQQKNEYARA